MAAASPGILALVTLGFLTGACSDPPDVDGSGPSDANGVSPPGAEGGTPSAGDGSAVQVPATEGGVGSPPDGGSTVDAPPASDSSSADAAAEAEGPLPIDGAALSCGAGCGAHGHCVGPTGVPECACDDGYYAVATTCIDKASCLSVVDCGAVAGGGDATAAFQKCLDMGKAQGKPVCVPAGVYNVRALNVDSVTLVGVGDASELFGQDASQYGLNVLGASPQIASLKMHTVGTARMSPDAISMVQATNYVVSNVTVDGADGVGIYAERSGPGRTTNSRVSNTLADGIHHTNSSHDIYVGGNTVRNAGDDMIAVVGYFKNGYVAETNLLIELNDVQKTVARGISVVGGNNVTIRNNKISQTQMAGIYVCSESAYTTWGDDNVLVSNNVIDQPAQKANTGHAGLFSYSDTSYLVQNVLYVNNVVTRDGNGQGQRAYGNIDRVFSSGNTLDGKALSGNGMEAGAPASITGTSVMP